MKLRSFYCNKCASQYSKPNLNNSHLPMLDIGTYYINIIHCNIIYVYSQMDINIDK